MMDGWIDVVYFLLAQMHLNHLKLPAEYARYTAAGWRYECSGHEILYNQRSSGILGEFTCRIVLNKHSCLNKDALKTLSHNSYPSFDGMDTKTGENR